MLRLPGKDKFLGPPELGHGIGDGQLGSGLRINDGLLRRTVKSIEKRRHLDLIH